MGRIPLNSNTIFFYILISFAYIDNYILFRYTRDKSIKPLLTSQPVVNEIPSCCKWCHGPVISELQILPTIIPTLKMSTRSENFDNTRRSQTSQQKMDKLPPTEAHEISASSVIEFGTVLLYTCQNSCDPTTKPQNASKNVLCNSKYVQEQVMLQSESI